MSAIKTAYGDSIASQTRLAEEISERFKIPCSKQLIQKWQRQWNPPFPRPSSNGAYNRAECFKWVETVYIPKMAAGGDVKEETLLIRAQNAKLQREIDRQEKERLELDEVKKTFIKKDVSERTLIGTLKTYHAFVRRSIETNLPDSRREMLQQLGVTPEIIAVFYELDRNAAQGVIDDIERRCVEAGRAKI